MGETVRVCDGIGQNDAVGSFVERFGDVPEALLASSVPNVESDLIPIH